MTTQTYKVIDAPTNRFAEVGELMVQVYSSLEGFPNKDEQPNYYKTLANIGDFTKNKSTRLLAAISNTGNIGGAVVYFNDMTFYGSGGTAPQEKHTAGFRLLAVHQNTRGKGIGKLLTKACIELAKQEQQTTSYYTLYKIHANSMENV